MKRNIYPFNTRWFAWLLLPGILFAPGFSAASTVTNLEAFHRHGQVFLTWTNAAFDQNYYRVYRSHTPIENGGQLASCEYLGLTHQNSALDIDLTRHFNQNYYLRIDSAGTPLFSNSGLFVATTLVSGNYYYAVTVFTGGIEDTTIIAGTNTIVQPVQELVSKPRPVFQQAVVINGKPVEIYTNFLSFKKSVNEPPANEAGWLASDFLINRNNSTGHQPLLVRWHGGGTDFFAEIANTVGNAVNLHIESLLPSGNSGEFWGSNSGFSLFSKNYTIPTSGVNHNFFQQLYKHTIDWAIEHLPIDSNRIYFEGSSSGACGAFAYIQVYPEKVAAAVLSVPCFNIGFETDADPKCSLNTGSKNRNEIDRMLGKVSTNLPNNLGYPTFSMLNGGWMAHQFTNRSYPFVYAINGKADFIVGWTEKTIYYDSVNANATGGYYFWDSRSHDGTGGHWNADNFNLLRFSRNVSYPAFSNCSLNEDYGDGSKESGAHYGTVNGALDWQDGITDTENTWIAKCFIRDLHALFNQIVVYPDSATVDITPRRMQHFNPPSPSVINWHTLHRADTLQSGSQVFTGGVITIRNLKILKDTIQVALSYLPAINFYADNDQDGYGNAGVKLIAAAAPQGYTSDSSDCNDADAFIHPGTAEACNLIDDNCDSAIDEGVQTDFHADDDGDGYGDSNKPVQACLAPPGYIADSTDCNDNEANIHPFAAELCNYADDNCDGRVDEDLQDIYYPDADGDGYGDVFAAISACLMDTGYVADSTDCRDDDAMVHPFSVEACNDKDDNCDGAIDENLQLMFYADADTDGFGDVLVPTSACFAGAGYVSDTTDCNDGDYNIHPNQIESCNNADDNCNGHVDEDAGSIFYFDADGDGHGNADSSIIACPAPAGYAGNATDCNDAAAFIHPGIPETCNHADDNCDGQVDEGTLSNYYADADGDGFGDVHSFISTCYTQTGFVSNAMDCNDADGNIAPTATEVCNGSDDNCDGQVDDGVQNMFYADADGDGFGDVNFVITACMAQAGYVADATDCNDGDANISPIGTEICNGKDENCDGLADEGVQTTFYADADGDGFGNVNSIMPGCMEQAGYVADATDCNDGDATIHPFNTETCNANDDNCDNQVDEGVQSIYYYDADGDSFGDSTISTTACSVPDGYVSDARDCNDSDVTVYPGNLETCNDYDDNCDNHVDEGVQTTFYADTDGDGFGDGGMSMAACSVPDGYVSDATDCHDGDAAIYPYSTETCNGKDDNCNGQTDEEVIDASINPAGNISICKGSTLILQASLAPDYIYQWQRDGNDIAGATSSWFEAGDGAGYNVLVSSGNCSTISAVTTIAVNALPLATVTPSGKTKVCPGTLVTFAANSGAALSHQWYHNNLAIAGATNSSYVTSIEGSYSVNISKTNGCNKTSEASVITNHTAPSTKITIDGQLNICTTGSVILKAKTMNGYSYQWYKNSLPIDGATFTTYTATSGGIYYYTVITQNGCSGSSGTKTVKECKTEQHAADTKVELTVYPNPTTDVIHLGIRMEGLEIGSAGISLVNSAGQVVYRESIFIEEGMQQITISLSESFPAGIYWLKVITAENVHYIPVSIVR